MSENGPYGAAKIANRTETIDESVGAVLDRYIVRGLTDLP